MEVEMLGEMLTIWPGSGARPEAQTQMLMGMGLGPAECCATRPADQLFHEIIGFRKTQFGARPVVSCLNLPLVSQVLVRAPGVPPAPNCCGCGPPAASSTWVAAKPSDTRSAQQAGSLLSVHSYRVLQHPAGILEA